MNARYLEDDQPPIFYDLMYDYVRDAEISHYRMSGDGEKEYRVVAFNPSHDPDFATSIDCPIEHDGKTYLPVCWGENESSALLESEIETAQCYILYRYADDAHEYVSDGTIYETYESAEQERTIQNMTDTQYYCERCDRVFEYRDIDQYGCECCNTTILDNNVAEVNGGGRDEL